MRCNSRLDSIQAAVFLKLPLLDEYNKAGQTARKYSAAFEGHKILFPSICDICCHVFINALRIVDADRNGLITFIR
jgi:hypothetical protein